MGLKIIKVTNIPLQVTKDQMHTMFRCIGEIEDIKLYPTERATSFNTRICFIKYKHSASVDDAYHLTNTYLMDRPLLVTPFFSADKGQMPSERKALEMLMTENYQKNPYFIGKVEEIPLVAPVETFEPILKQNGLPPYPPLPAHYDASKVEQIRRTLVVANLDSSVSGLQVIEHFSKAGEVKYVRFCKRKDDPGIYSLVEFTNHEAIIPGLKLNDTEIIKGGRVKVYHSVQAIEKSLEEILNGVMLNKLTSTLTETACNVSSEGDNSETLGQSQHRPRSSVSSHHSCTKSSCDHFLLEKSRSDQKRRSKCRRQNVSRERSRCRRHGRRSRSKARRSRSRGRRSNSREKRSRSQKHRRLRCEEWRRSRSLERSSTSPLRRSESGERRSESHEKRSRSRNHRRLRCEEVRRSKSQARSPGPGEKRSESQEKRSGSRNHRRLRCEELRRSRSQGSRSSSREKRSESE